MEQSCTLLGFFAIRTAADRMNKNGGQNILLLTDVFSRGRLEGGSSGRPGLILLSDSPCTRSTVDAMAKCLWKWGCPGHG